MTENGSGLTLGWSGTPQYSKLKERKCGALKGFPGLKFTIHHFFLSFSPSFFSDKVVKLFGGGSVINGAMRSSLDTGNNL